MLMIFSTPHSIPSPPKVFQRDAVLHPRGFSFLAMRYKAQGFPSKRESLISHCRKEKCPPPFFTPRPPSLPPHPTPPHPPPPLRGEGGRMPYPKGGVCLCRESLVHKIKGCRGARGRSVIIIKCLQKHSIFSSNRRSR
jgi:hypothetical protein